MFSTAALAGRSNVPQIKVARQTTVRVSPHEVTTVTVTPKHI